EASKPQNPHPKEFQPAGGRQPLEGADKPDWSASVSLAASATGTVALQSERRFGIIGLIQRLSPAPRVLSILTDREAGAHAPGFMLSCATRTVVEESQKSLHQIFLHFLFNVRYALREAVLSRIRSAWHKALRPHQLTTIDSNPTLRKSRPQKQRWR